MGFLACSFKLLHASVRPNPLRDPNARHVALGAASLASFLHERALGRLWRVVTRDRFHPKPCQHLNRRCCLVFLGRASDNRLLDYRRSVRQPHLLLLLLRAHALERDPAWHGCSGIHGLLACRSCVSARVRTPSPTVTALTCVASSAS